METLRKHGRIMVNRVLDLGVTTGELLKYWPSGTIYKFGPGCEYGARRSIFSFEHIIEDCAI